MKTIGKKGLLTAILALAAAALLAIGLTFWSVPASAAEGDVFDYGFLNNRTYVTGITQDEVKAAFNEEGTRLKQAMTDAGVGDQYQIVNAPLGNGWPSANDTYFVAAHMDLGSYSGWNNWGRTGYAFIVLNPHTKEAYTVKGDAAVAYVNMNNGWTNQVTHLGYPKGNDFTVGDVTYQNFTLGYAKNAEVVYGKNVDEEGQEFDLTVDMIAESMVAPVYQDTASDEVIEGLAIADFVAAYKEYYAGKEINTNPMSVINTRNNSIWRQKAADGEVVYNKQLKKMFTVTSTFLAAYNGTTEWGNPIGEQTTIQGVVNQLFTNGVAVVEDEAVKFYTASHVDPDTGEIVSDFSGNEVGAMDNTVAAELPSGVTKEAVQEAVQAVYEEEMGAPTGLMQFFEGTQVLMQTFTTLDETGDSPVTLTTQIFVDVAADTLSASVLASDTYAVYQKPVRFNEGNQLYELHGTDLLGPATSNEFTVEGVTYQNFLYGAMNLSATDEEDMVLPGVNYAADGTRTVLDLSDLIEIDADEIRIPQSFEVGPADLLEAFTAAYKEYIESGYALGVPSVEGITAWPATDGGQEEGTNEFVEGRGMIILGLYSTDSTAICYYGVTAYLAYNPEDGEIYLMTDAVVSNMATYYSTYGAPRCNLTETTIIVGEREVTVLIQNFQLGYLIVQGTAASMIADYNWDFDLLGAVNLDGSKIPGTEYPGEATGDPSDDPSGDPSDDPSDDPADEEKGGCSGTVSVAVSVLAGGIVLAAAIVAIVAKKRRA